MRLLFTSSAFPRPQDPSRAPYNLRLCEALAEAHDVIVVSPVPWTKWRAVARGHHRVGTLRDVRYPLFVYPPAILRDSHAWCMRHSMRRVVRSALAGRPPDAVVSYWTYPDGAAAADLAGELQAPVVMMVGGSDVEVLAQHADHRQRIAHTLRRADAIVATSCSLRQSIQSLGVDPDRIAIVRRGIDRGTFHPAERDAARQSLGISPAERTLLWVGRLDPVKGPDLLVEALALIDTRGSVEWRCHMIGDGAMRNALTMLIARRSFNGRITLAGALPPPVLARWYQAADAVVISSRSEGLPNVLLEAKACGVPVVATDVGGVRELLDENDRLVPPNDPAALAAAVSDLIRNQPRVDASLLAARSPLPSWRDSAAALTTVIARVVASSGSSAVQDSMP
jgi:glycosyltransferase involved in cell wall biosynthesis